MRLREAADGSLVYEQRIPDDWHLHLRQCRPASAERGGRDLLLPLVLPETERQFGRALIMPNIKPPILDGDDVKRYREDIVRQQQTDFQPLMTIKILDSTTLEMLESARAAGAVAGKVYPRGVTSHAEDGVADFRTRHLCRVYAAMADMGMRLCLHGELPGENIYCLDREALFQKEARWLAEHLPRLTIVLEHISDRRSLETVNHYENVWATVTVHHLILTTNDVIDGKIRPDNFCLPVAKRHQDRDIIRAAVFAGHQKVFFGSDSAPWLAEDKYGVEGCGGIFSAPAALSLLTALFEQRGGLKYLEDFTSAIGARCYDLKPNAGTLRLIKKKWTVPRSYGGITPFYAGRTLAWQVESRS